MTWPRRKFCQTLGRAFSALALHGARCFGNSAPAIDQFSDFSGDWKSVRSRSYRADVVVTLLGVPIFSRRGVGSAFASLRERSRANHKIIALSLAGGSDPKRTHGIEFCGSVEEIAIETDSELKTAASFGFVTGSNSDESLDQARRRALNGIDANGSFVVVDELHTAARIRVRRASLPMETPSCTDFGRLRSDMRLRFMSAETSEREIASAEAPVPPTFLYTTCAAMCSPGPAAFSYVHNGKGYTLSCECSPLGSRAGAETIVTGRIRELESKRHSTFRLWLAPGSDLPARIEFSPRPYLRITLEHDTSVPNQEGM